MAAKATRQVFGETLAKLGEKYPQIVALDADLSKSTMTLLFAKKFPDRFFEMGIAEMNMAGTGAGLALTGKIPFVCSFACFLTGRYDTIRISIAYSQAKVVLVGTHAGIGIGEDGNSQMGLEDITLMRALPHMAVIQPADEVETAGAVEYLVHHKGPAYLRLTRQKLEPVNPPDYKFQFGKGVTLRDGDDVTIMATGGVVYNSLKAAELLANNGTSARVVNVHTIKPIDKELIAKCARETGAIVTVEDHTIVGGFGSAVCEALADTVPVPVLRIGLSDVFGESGDPAALYKKYGFDPEGIANKTSEFLDSRVASSRTK